MIGKATTGRSFSGLAAYLTGHAERVAWTEPRWMIGTDTKEIAREMEAAAALATSRLEKPVYHVSISFSETDQPTREQMQAAADHVLRELGLEQHQAFLVAHKDKNHPHLHIMVNRVHPDTGKVADVAFDYQKIETVLRELEKDWNMTRVSGHHARSAGDEAPARAEALSTGAVRQARRSGEVPFPQAIRERMGDELNKAIEQAKNWDELRAALARHGYRIEPTDRGMVITDGERFAKASSVDERLGRFRLEERFGEPLRAEERRGAAPRAEKPVDPGLPSSSPDREAPVEAARQATSGNGPMKGDVAVPTERAAGEVGGRSSIYEALFGRPALERREGSPGTGAGELLGAAAAAARPVSAEDGEKEVPLRVVEVGLRGAAALAGRSEASRAEPGQSEQRQTEVPERLGPDRADNTTPARAAGEPTAGSMSPDVQRGPSYDPDRPGLHPAPSPDHRTAPLLAAPDPEVRQLVRDVQTYERGVQAERGLSAAAGAYAEAETRWKAAERQGQEVTRLSQTFDRALGEAYRDPGAARRAFEAMADEKGPAVAARIMRQEPERFGAVAEVAQKKWMGLATEVSKAEGYAAARGAANVGEQYLHSRAALPGVGSSPGPEAMLAARGAEIKALRQELSRIGSPSALLEQIGRQARGLTSAQMVQLGRVLTPEQLGVVMKAAGIPERVARGYDR